GSSCLLHPLRGQFPPHAVPPAHAYANESTRRLRLGRSLFPALGSETATLCTRPEITPRKATSAQGRKQATNDSLHACDRNLARIRAGLVKRCRFQWHIPRRGGP